MSTEYVASTNISNHSSAPETPLRAHLHAITLESPDPKALAEFYGRAMGFAFHDGGEAWVGIGVDRRLSFRRGAARRLAEACYRVEAPDALASLAARLKQSNIEFTHAPDAQFSAALRFIDPDGNVMRFAYGNSPPGASHGDPLTQRAARLQHLVLASSNAKRMIDFYRDVVGFRTSDTVLDDSGGLRTAFLNCSHEHHSLAVFATHENRLDHFCFEVGDWGLIRDWADHFAAERIALKWGPGRHGPGNNLFAFIHDLDGNWVEISAELEQITPDRREGTWRHEEGTLNSWGVGLLRS